MIKAHLGLIEKTTLGVVVATPSTVARGTMKAVLWFFDPPCPVEVASTIDEAFDLLCTWIEPAAIAETRRHYLPLRDELEAWPLRE